jgi:hypothetical protein
MRQPRHYYQSIDGWFDYEDVWRQAVREVPDGGTVVEVGCWKGKSLSFLLVEAARASRRLRIIGVDHFRGSPGESYHLEEAARVDLEAVCRANGERAGYPFELLRLPSVAATARFPDDSLDFVFVDAAHGYADVRADVGAWLPKVRWGGTLAGHDWEGAWPGVRLGVRDFIPESEVRTLGVSWLWRKEVPPRGHWVARPGAGADWLVYVPHVNREDLLRNALTSLGHYARRAVVIDQSGPGLSPDFHDGPTFRWEGPCHFTGAMNWVQREAGRRGLRRFLFMHSDAEATPATVERLLGMADDLEDRGARWGVIFTHYDALCCFNPAAVREVGCWDESFAWYVSDVDFYNCIRWQGWTQEVLSGAEVVHHGSQTIRALPAGERAAVEHDQTWAVNHYRHKWGCHWDERPEGRAFTTPYDGRP